VNLGETLTATELAGLNIAPALRSGEALPSDCPIIYVPRNGGRIPISLLARLPASSAADTPVRITELPSNGAVFLADGMTLSFAVRRLPLHSCADDVPARR